MLTKGEISCMSSHNRFWVTYACWATSYAKHLYIPIDNVCQENYVCQAIQKPSIIREHNEGWELEVFKCQENIFVHMSL